MAASCEESSTALRAGRTFCPASPSSAFIYLFPGIVTFPSAKLIQAAARIAPSDRILVETDCPFLAPQKMRGKRNEPSYVWHVAEKLAELRAVTVEEICQACCANTRLLFGLPVVDAKTLPAG